MVNGMEGLMGREVRVNRSVWIPSHLSLDGNASLTRRMCLLMVKLGKGMNFRAWNASVICFSCR